MQGSLRSPALERAIRVAVSASDSHILEIVNKAPVKELANAR